LDASEAERLKFQPQKGVPLDSVNNQLRDWIQISATELNAIYMRNKDKAAEVQDKSLKEKSLAMRLKQTVRQNTFL
jgi:hypothetical protein